MRLGCYCFGSKTVRVAFDDDGASSAFKHKTKQKSGFFFQVQEMQMTNNAQARSAAGDDGRAIYAEGGEVDDGDGLG
jgi:hypothetical protein